MTESLHIERLAVIGVGLIGGSLALALREAGAVGEIVGCGRSRENLEQARALGIIDRYTQDIGSAVAGADVVFLAVPLGAMREALAALKGCLREDAVVTDGGSAKGSLLRDAEAVFGACPSWLVPGHPIAGTERSGATAAFATLYRQRRVILTPHAASDPRACARVTAMWRACGAEVTQMDARHHDEVLAATSHLPHMLAFGLVDLLARMQETDEIFRYAAGGFRDFTRIASSNPAMWRDIALANAGALVPLMRQMGAELQALAAAVERGDGERLLTVFERARAARDAYVDTADDRFGAASPPPQG